VPTGKELLTLKGHTKEVHSVAFCLINNLGANLLASGSADATIRVWDTGTGKEVLLLKGHTKEVRGVAFSRVNGFNVPHLASGSFDGTVKVWTVVRP